MSSGFPDTAQPIESGGQLPTDSTQSGEKPIEFAPSTQQVPSGSGKDLEVLMW